MHYFVTQSALPDGRGDQMNNLSKENAQKVRLQVPKLLLSDNGKVSVVKEGKRSYDGTWSPPMFRVKYMKRNQ